MTHSLRCAAPLLAVAAAPDSSLLVRAVCVCALACVFLRRLSVLFSPLLRRMVALTVRLLFDGDSSNRFHFLQFVKLSLLNFKNKPFLSIQGDRVRAKRRVEEARVG